MIALIIAAYVGAGLLTGGLVVRQILTPPVRGQRPKVTNDTDRMIVGVIGLAAAAAWPVVLAVIAGAWLLWALGLVFEAVGRVR